MTSLPVISCENCCACCMSMGYPPFVAWPDSSDWHDVPAYLKPAVIEAIHDGRADRQLPCIWLDMKTKRCKHYEFRPHICAEFEVGAPDCLAERERIRLKNRQ